MHHTVTGREKIIDFGGRQFRFLNQRSRDWTHPYAYAADPNAHEDMHDAGCGIFSIAHCVEWMNGQRINIEDLADFACTNGGRGDDGTDRPALLSAMAKQGLAERMGFAYKGDGLLNDNELLWQHMLAGNTALCNLRVGHIVSLVDARKSQGHRQLLAIDSYSESAHEKVRDSVCECIPGTTVLSETLNNSGLSVGRSVQYAMFWVDCALPKDFNLLHKL